MRAETWPGTWHETQARHGLQSCVGMRWKQMLATFGYSPRNSLHFLIIKGCNNDADLADVMKMMKTYQDGDDGDGDDGGGCGDDGGGGGGGGGGDYG